MFSASASLFVKTIFLKTSISKLPCRTFYNCNDFTIFNACKNKLWSRTVSLARHSKHSGTEPLIQSVPPGKGSRNKQLDTISSFITSNNELSALSLTGLKKTVLSLGSDINETNFDSVFLSMCIRNKSFGQGKSFFLSLQSQNSVNLASAGKFLKLCFDHKDMCTDEDKELIKIVCRELMTNYPVLDVGTYESIICGLSVTDAWKEAVNILEKSAELGVLGSTAYSAIVGAAFMNNNNELGWAIMEDMIKMKKVPSKSVYVAWLSKNKSDKALNMILSFISRYCMTPSEEIADVIVDHYQHLKQSKMAAQLTNISSNGMCKNCKQFLQPVKVSPEEFVKLRDAFLKPVLIGTNVFLKSKPDEVNDYLKFISNVGRVDVVLDGLNIAYAAGLRKSTPQVFSKMLKDVVKHFVNKKMKVMVIGRKHMTSWPSNNMNFLFKFSSVFLAENISADDPLLLFGAMHSGLGTIFVSRDLMKGHKFLLKEPTLQQVFTRWQQKHQYYLKHVDISGNVILQEPLPYLQDAHNFNGVWHIPVNTGSQPGLLPQYRPQQQTWMCLQ